MRWPTPFRLALGIWVLAGFLSGCSTLRDMVGFPSPGDPSVTLRSTEPRWLLIKNPRFGSVASEPEYVWVEEDKVPTTFRTLVFGKKSIIAPPEIVAKYGAPPGGGRISPRQGAPYEIGAAPVQASPSGRGLERRGAPVPAQPSGLVIFVDSGRFVTDLTSGDGVRLGAVVSVRRDKIPIVHPITGELLGQLDEEVATGRITEIRDKFSVAEIQSLTPGAEIKVKDRVVVR